MTMAVPVGSADAQASEHLSTHNPCEMLNGLLDMAYAGERRCTASAGIAQQPALKAELVLRAAEHAGDAERLHAAVVLMRCTPHNSEADAAVHDPLWLAPPLSQPDDAALLHSCMAEERVIASRCEQVLDSFDLPQQVREAIECCLRAARRREQSLGRLASAHLTP